MWDVPMQLYDERTTGMHWQTQNMERNTGEARKILRENSAAGYDPIQHNAIGNVADSADLTK